MRNPNLSKERIGEIKATIKNENESEYDNNVELWNSVPKKWTIPPFLPVIDS